MNLLNSLPLDHTFLGGWLPDAAGTDYFMIPFLRTVHADKWDGVISQCFGIFGPSNYHATYLKPGLPGLGEHHTTASLQSPITRRSYLKGNYALSLWVYVVLANTRSRWRTKHHNTDTEHDLTPRLGTTNPRKNCHQSHNIHIIQHGRPGAL